jgi:KDO2-lipid IV(A) lauroyltransferase
MNFRDRAVDLGYGAAWRIGRALPGGPTLAVAGRIADRSARRDWAGVAQLRANLRRVLGPQAPAAQLEETVRGAMRSYARYWVETFRLPSISAGQVVADTDMAGFEHVEEAAGSGRGAVLALPHSGNWDAAGVYLVAHGHPFTTVVERLRPEALFRRFLAFRESLGMTALPLTGGPPPAPRLVEALRGGGVVCLLGDRALREGGVPVTLFGEAALLPAGPALLAARTGAALLPVGCSFTPGGWRVRVGAPLEAAEGSLAQRTRALSAALAARFEAHIRAHPADWHMLQRVWSADRPARAGQPGPPARAGAAAGRRRGQRGA